ncbi:enoyl-CoA hydratase/isomerase family protein [Streptomyces sp. NPDC002817]|uniref:enoyl-CoA hydratase/isomerase family protein n=1 Tax=Streptomyces sp. NPDC088357 TaxID=3154655 RepID=UPI00341C3DBD
MLNDFKTLRVESSSEGRVLRVQLNRPDEGNTITRQVLNELQTVLDWLEDDRSVRVLVLSGAGTDFSKGGERTEFAPLLDEDPSGTALRALGNKAQRVCESLSKLQVATVARIQGDVIGAGLGLAIFCDVRVGADNCRFVMPETVLGVPPAWGGVLPRLQAEAGQAWIRRLLLTAESFDAVTAERLAILQEVVPAVHLDEAVERWVKQLVRKDPTTIRILKTMLNATANTSQLALSSYYDAELLTSAVTRRAFSRRG